MSYRRERYNRPRRRGNSCLIWLVALIWIALIAVIAYQFWLRPRVSQYIGNQIGEELREQNGRQIEEGAASTLPTAIAALPAGELRISEAQANAYLASRAGSFGPVDAITVRFVPGEVQADLRAYGTTSTARMGLAVQAGRIIAVEPELDGPLGQVIALPDLIRTLEKQLNDQLAMQGRRISDVQIGQGELVITIEG